MQAILRLMFSIEPNLKKHLMFLYVKVGSTFLENCNRLTLNEIHVPSHDARVTMQSPCKYLCHPKVNLSLQSPN